MSEYSCCASHLLVNKNLQITLLERDGTGIPGFHAFFRLTRFNSLTIFTSVSFMLYSSIVIFNFTTFIFF